MSKYVRTENGIYEVIEENSNYYKCCYDNGRITLVAKFDNDVNGFSKALKQADTIEELCDEAVAVYPDGMHDNCSVMHIVDNNGFCEAVYGCLSVSCDDLKKDYECYEVYGAIWTDKGLIYVAKMNEKGELVLI